MGKLKTRNDNKKPVHMLVEQPLLDGVEAWRRKQPVIPPRAEALRELVRRGLLHDEKKQHP